MYQLFASCILALVSATFVWADPSPDSTPPIAKEPTYQQAKQQYYLLLLGQKPARPIWVVRDGLDFYIDRNGNGDLTEAADKVTVEKPKVGSFVHVHLGQVRDAQGVEHGPLEVLIDARSGLVARLSMSIAKKYKQTAYFVPVRTTPTSACVLHFDGPLSSGFLSNVDGRPGPVDRPEAFPLSRSKDRYLASWVGTQIKGSPPVYCALPADALKPQLKIVYEPREGQKPPTETYELEDETPDRYSRRVRAPQGAGGKARITLTFPSLPEVRKYEIEVRVVD